MKLNLKIVTPDRTFFEGLVDSIIVRGIEGDLAILNGHTPFMTGLQIAPSKIIDGDNSRIFTLASGYIYVEKDKTTVVADSCEWADEIDVDRAIRAKERAEKRIKEKSSEVDLYRAELALKKAINRINIGSK